GSGSRMRMLPSIQSTPHPRMARPMIRRGVMRKPLLPFMFILLAGGIAGGWQRRVDDRVEHDAESGDDERDRERLPVRESEDAERPGEHPDPDAEQDVAAVAPA